MTTSDPKQTEERGEELSPEDKDLLDQALKNLMQFVEAETALDMWDLDEPEPQDE